MTNTEEVRVGVVDLHGDDDLLVGHLDQLDAKAGGIGISRQHLSDAFRVESTHGAAE
jgi:hypothetical protein